MWDYTYARELFSMWDYTYTRYYLKSLSRSMAVQNGSWTRVFRVYFDNSCLFNIS